MRLQKLINECAKALQENANDGYMPGSEDDSVLASVSTEDADIDLCYKKGEVEVTIYHCGEKDHDSRNLQNYLAENLEDCIDWDAIREEWNEGYMDEYQRHGFSSEADFWRWKEG